jgi:hypothetical protein
VPLSLHGDLKAKLRLLVFRIAAAIAVDLTLYSLVMDIKKMRKTILPVKRRRRTDQQVQWQLGGGEVSCHSQKDTIKHTVEGKARSQ